MLPLSGRTDCFHDRDTRRRLVATSSSSFISAGQRFQPHRRTYNLPNNNNYDIKVKHTNSKYCRFCIRHEIPKLIQDNYLPGKVLEKLNTHSYFGFVHYAQNYIISEYESICCIRKLLHAMIEYIFELTRNETAISTLISLTSYDSK